MTTSFQRIICSILSWPDYTTWHTHSVFSLSLHLFKINASDGQKWASCNLCPRPSMSPLASRRSAVDLTNQNINQSEYPRIYVGYSLLTKSNYTLVNGRLVDDWGSVMICEGLNQPRSNVFFLLKIIIDNMNWATLLHYRKDYKQYGFIFKLTHIGVYRRRVFYF